MAPTESRLCYKRSADAWQTKVQERLRLPFPLGWILIAAILFLVGYAILTSQGKSTGAIRLLAIDCALIAAIANAVIFYERMLDDLADSLPDLLDEHDQEADDWIRRWYETVFWSRKNILVGMCLAAICLAAGGGAPSTDHAPMACVAYSHFLCGAIGLLGGSMFWTMLGIAGLMASLGKDVRIRPSIFDAETSALRAASAVLWKVSLIASLVYILGTSRYYFCSLKMGTPMVAIVSVFGVFVLLYFVVPQVNVHKTLVTLKRTRLKALVSQIDKTFDSVAESPTSENIGQLRDLFDLQHVLDGKRSWGFGTRELLLLLGSVLVPLAIFLLEHLLNG